MIAATVNPPESNRPDAAEAANAGEEKRTDGWAELYTTSMGGVSITYYENGSVKRVYPGDSLTFTFPDGRAEQFHLGDRVPYPPPPGVVVPMHTKNQDARSFLQVVFGTLVKGFLFGVLIYVTYIVATVYIF